MTGTSDVRAVSVEEDIVRGGWSVVIHEERGDGCTIGRIDQETIVGGSVKGAPNQRKEGAGEVKSGTWT